MNPRAWMFKLFAASLFLGLLVSVPAKAQGGGATLSGIVTTAMGTVVPNARITVKNVATGQFVETRSDVTGLYTVKNLIPGDYEVTVSADGLSSPVTKVSSKEGQTQTVNLVLSGGISLGDLGFPSSQTQGSDVDQARLDKRSHMLKIHQELGLITAAPMVAACFTGGFAGGKATSSSNRDLHIALGSVTAGMYFTTAYYAMFAPRIQGTKTRGSIKLHKALVFVHGPGMILTPILGVMAYDEKSRGEKVHGIAAAHGAVAIVTAAAFGVSILAVSLKW
jgi:hypothetical protein